MKLREKLWKFIRDEEAQSTTEYILILAVVVMIALKFRDKIGNTITNATDKISGKIDSTIDVLDQ